MHKVIMASASTGMSVYRRTVIAAPHKDPPAVIDTQTVLNNQTRWDPMA